MKDNLQSYHRRSLTWRLAGVAAMLMCLILAGVAARPGLAALLASSAELSNDITATDLALRVSSGDPDLHLLRANLMETQGDFTPAITEYEKAASLRPDDYALWIMVARARELNGNQPEALAAASKAIALAPFYAQPHWQLGNILVRAGKTDEGFEELRLAAQRNPSLLPATIELASQLSKGDAQLITRWVRPDQAETYMAMARHFRRHGDMDAALAIYQTAGNDSKIDQDRRQFISELIAARRFNQAFELWCGLNPDTVTKQSGAIDDPGFEEERDLQAPGFGWRADNGAATLKRTLDSVSPREGRFSLRIDFNGAADPGSPIISQLVKTEARHHYQLSFSFRSEDLVSGGLPKLLVVDARTDRVLAQTETFLKSSNGWQDVTLKFVSGEPDSAVRIVLVRGSCERAPCPIFGSLWLDAFSVRDD